MMPNDTTPSEGASLIEAPTVTTGERNKGINTKSEQSLASLRRSRGPLVSWWLEGLATVVSLVLLAAIMAILYHFDGKEQPDWPYWINLNTVVATLSTILRAQLLLVAAEGQSYSLPPPHLAL